MRTRTLFGNAQYFNFMLRNMSILKDTADTAAEFSAAQTYVARVEILNPYLARLAPVADELTDLLRVKGRATQRVAALKLKILDAIANEPRPELVPASPGEPMVVGRALPFRDGKWLEGGRKFFVTYVLPILIAQLEQSLAGK